MLTCSALFGPDRPAGGGDPVGSGDRSAEEIEAALVYKFLRYVEWNPERFPSAKTPLSVGLVGSGPMVRELKKAFEDKRYGRRDIELHHFERPEAVKDCHLLFVTAAVSKDTEKREAALARIPAKGVFVIGEHPGFAQAGGVLNFYLEGDGELAKVRFEINPDEAKRRDLSISAGLLKLARIVRDREDDDDGDDGDGEGGR